MGPLGAPAQAQDGPQQDRRIVDVHLHALPTSSFPPQADSMVGYERPASGRAVMRQTIDQLERFNVTTAIETADVLTEKQKRAIFYENAARFFGLGNGGSGDS